MHKNIRARTNEIFNKIWKSLDRQITIKENTKFVVSRSESQYQTGRK